MTQRAVRAALLCAAVLVGCAREEADRKKAERTSREPRALTAAEVLEQAAKASYQPPADGRLTEKQLRMYLDVKRRARKIRRAEPAGTADLRASLELGYNPKEQSWIKERVLEAWIALRGQELDRKIAESRNRITRELETELKSAKDPRQKAELEKQIAEIRAAAPPATEAPPAVDRNAALVQRHEAEVARAFADEHDPKEDRNAD